MKTWKRKPSFSRVVSSRGKKIRGEVSTDNEIYRYVNNGTKRHFVAPKRARALAFPSKYKAKTSPGRISARGGGASGNIAFSKGHFVDGIKARNFDRQIKKLREDNFVDDMSQALDNIAEVS